MKTKREPAFTNSLARDPISPTNHLHEKGVALRLGDGRNVPDLIYIIHAHGAKDMSKGTSDTDRIHRHIKKA